LSWGQSPATSTEDQPAAQPSEAPPPDFTETPDYNEERAWHEREKRLIAELDRRQKAGELVYKADVEQAQMAVALTLKNQLEALPNQTKQQLPHLSISDEEMIERLVAKVLTAVADWRMSQEEEE
jgi:phage terminase Nu1 subunit (DNA packaging protein)